MNPQFMVSAHMQSNQHRKRILSLDRVRSDGDPHDPGVMSGALSINHQALLDNCSLESINLEDRPPKSEIKFVDQRAEHEKRTEERSDQRQTGKDEQQAYMPPPKSAMKSQFDLTFSEQMHSQEPNKKPGAPTPPPNQPPQEFNYPPQEDPS
mmetsp:Transcript_3772/g.5697  ORF Transcript_3772/g.5697 Transcript_3772/m.5697 type:complete len:152 (+) Transcript_3772:1240-1695(+)